MHHHDWLPTFLSMAGEPDIVEKLKRGHTANGKRFRVHIDGYDLVPYLTGREKKSPRQGFIYFSDDGDLVALRFDNWKVVFMEQRAPGTMRVWGEPFVPLRVPKLYNLRTDESETTDVASSNPEIVVKLSAIMDKEHVLNKDFPIKGLGDPVPETPAKKK